MDSTPHTLWQKCLDIIRQTVPEQHFRAWFEPLELVSFQADELLLCVPNQFFCEYFDQHYAAYLMRAMNAVCGGRVRLNYKLKPAPVQNATNEPLLVVRNDAGQNRKGNPQAAPKPAPVDPQLNPRYTFENFVEGASNKLARSVGISIAETPGKIAFNPFFLYGPSGVGKTHMVNAIGVRIRELYPEKRVLFVSAHVFKTQFTDSVIHNTQNEFINFYQSIDTLIIDDVQEFASLQKTQNTFFHIFNHLHRNGRQIILTSDRHPGALMGMEERLLTRFKWGLMAELEKPEEKLRRAILASKIHHDGLNISPDVIEYIAHNVDESVRELEGVVHSLLANSIVFNKDVVDLEFAKRILSHGRPAMEARSITVDRIIEEACTCCNVRQEDVYGKSRKADIVEVRQLSMYLAQKYTTLTNSRIGVLVGNRNHATVCHAIKNVEHKLKVSTKFQQTVSRIEEKLKGKS